MSETAETRASQVEALKQERAFLSRQPSPNKGRIKLIDEQLDAFSDTPSRPRRQTAVKGGARKAAAKKAAATPPPAPADTPDAGTPSGD